MATCSYRVNDVLIGVLNSLVGDIFQASPLGPGGMNPLLQALGDKPSSRQSFLYTGPSTDLDAIQQRPQGGYRPPDRRISEENGGGPPRGDGPKMVSGQIQ